MSFRGRFDDRLKEIGDGFSDLPEGVTKVRLFGQSNHFGIGEVARSLAELRIALPNPLGISSEFKLFDNLPNPAGKIPTIGF